GQVMAGEISGQRKTAYYFGLVLMIVGGLLFASTIVTFIVDFGDFRDFAADTKSGMLRAVVFAVAFLSLGAQLPGLVGSGGILPASETLRSVASDPGLAGSRFWILPTLCWISPSDLFLAGLSVAGVVLAVALALGFAPVPCLLGLWALYLSLAAVCREFLWFQWDGLLLESAFLGMFLSPWALRATPSRAPAPSFAALWSTRWLLFRLLVASAAVKLLSGDPSWRDLTALRYHYETQPLPTWIAWYVHLLPLWFHRVAAGFTFLVEGLVPFLIFAPRRARFLAAGLIAAHQLLIALTGNYGFFNLLTLVLCVLLLDDGFWPRSWTARFRGRGEVRGGGWPVWLRRSVLGGVFLLSLAPFLAAVGTPLRWLGPLPGAYQLFTPFRTVNQYGLFAIMTKARPEILVEGSRDGVDWKPYEFRYKPGDPSRRPGFVAPFQPRLDWQMWFAALSDYRSEGWFLSFCDRLLRGSAPVTGLLRANPFPGDPPRYVRSVVYRYRFTDGPTRRATGAWWSREPAGLYAPVLTLDRGKLAPAGAELQRW
ncbi:MAG TPA: lipase maturation factor family protein, partial [Candidatus Saccharimonadales bacterium]|nr:lipase maturation factor family protein [Candidatus Saccharimonadales bacterium]